MFVYQTPASTPEADGGRHAGTKASAFTLQDLTRSLWRRKAAIAMAALIGACLAVMVGKSLSPRYLAVVELYVDPRELQLVDRELTPRPQDMSGLAMVVESQARLITSTSVLMPVIDKLKLEADPEFGGAPDSLWQVLRNLVGSGDAATDANSRRLAILESLRRHINVRRADRTFVVDVEVWSNDPSRAADLANAIATGYLAESMRTQAAAARRATGDLSGRLSELQTRLRNAENALAAYKAKNDFVGSQDMQVSDQQLSASAQRFAVARVQALDAQARYDQIEALRRGVKDSGAIPEALQSATITALRTQYADTRRRYAEMVGDLGPRHPALKNMQRQVDDLRRNIDEEVDRIAQAAKNDLARAREYEQSLGKVLDEQKRNSISLSQSSVQLRELEREVDASRSVYQSFLKRSREIEEQESLNTSTARIVSEASPPRRRAFPPAMSVIAMFGFILAAFASGLVVLYLDRRTPAGPAKPLDVAAADVPQPKEEQRKEEAIVSSPPEVVPEAPPTVPAAEAPGAPLVAWLGRADVSSPLHQILRAPNSADIAALGWPTLLQGHGAAPFVENVREMLGAVGDRGAKRGCSVVAVAARGDDVDRSLVAVNFAIASARTGARVLLIDADPGHHLLSDQHPANGKNAPATEPKKGSRVLASRVALSGIDVAGLRLPIAKKAAQVDILKAIAEARTSLSYDVIVLDGPSLDDPPAASPLLEASDGIVAAIAACADPGAVVASLIGSLKQDQTKLVGIVLSELTAEKADQPARMLA